MTDRPLSPVWAFCVSSLQDGSSAQVGRSPLLPRKRMGDLCNTAFSSKKGGKQLIFMAALTRIYLQKISEICQFENSSALRWPKIYYCTLNFGYEMVLI